MGLQGIQGIFDLQSHWVFCNLRVLRLLEVLQKSKGSQQSEGSKGTYQEDINNNRHIVTWLDGWKDGWSEGWTEGKDGRTDAH